MNDFLNLSFKLNRNSSIAFEELPLFQAFVFEKHVDMVSPHIQIKVSEERAALLIDFVAPPHRPFNGGYNVDRHIKCFKLR